jgi:hypothetical protein
MNVETGSSAALQRRSDVLIIGGGPAGSTAAITSTAPAHQYPTRRARPDDRGLMGC